VASLALRISIFERNIAALDETTLAQGLMQRDNELCIGIGSLPKRLKATSENGGAAPLKTILCFRFPISINSHRQTSS
jgi:hypothetical protein